MTDIREYCFDDLYGEYYFWLLNRLQRLTHDREMSKDLVQQTFFTVYCVYFISRENCNFDSPESMLFKIASTYHENLVKKNNNIIKAQKHFSADHLFFNEDISLEVLDHVHRNLTGEMRIYFVMYFYYGFSYVEISKITKSSMYVIRVSISKAIKILQKEIKWGI